MFKKAIQAPEGRRPAVPFSKYFGFWVRCLGARRLGCAIACYIVSCRFVVFLSSQRLGVQNCAKPDRVINKES